MPDAIDVKTIVVLADCHIHPGGGVEWDDAALAAFLGADLIVTLGDMGERAGLDALAAIAPVIGVRGADDEDDERTAPRTRVLEAGALRIGCVFDAVAAGLTNGTKSPIEVSADAATAAFGGPIDVLLWASTHIPSIERTGGRVIVNPGSAMLPDAGAPRSFARLTLEAGAVDAEIVSIGVGAP